jgi:hypothetical protein
MALLLIDLDGGVDLRVIQAPTGGPLLASRGGSVLASVEA